MQSGDPDIREGVQDSQGLLKKIQLHIPIFKGYRKLEDIRVADELLRKQLSDILENALQSLQNERASEVNAGHFEKLTSIASGMSGIQKLQGDLLHAEQGSTGISPAIRLDEGKLNSLYEYDLKFLDISARIRELSNLSAPRDIDKSLRELSGAIQEAGNAWNSRIEAVEKILLRPDGE